MEATMFTTHCPHCNSQSVQPKRNQPGVYYCQSCKCMDILASELKLKPITYIPDPKNRPTVYGTLN